MNKLYFGYNQEICMFALKSLIPFLVNKQMDIKKDKYIVDMNRLCCPDPGGVIFKITEK